MKTETVEARLYAALLAFCEDRGIELERSAMADLCIPIEGNVIYRVPIEDLEDAPK